MCSLPDWVHLLHQVCVVGQICFTATKHHNIWQTDFSVISNLHIVWAKIRLFNWEKQIRDHFTWEDYFTHRDWEKSTWVFHSLVQTAGRLCPWNKQQNHVSVSVMSSLFRVPALVMFWIVLVSWRPCCIKHFHMWDTDEPNWTDWSVS